MNFGAFAGGLSRGVIDTSRDIKNIRDIIKERKIADLQAKGMEEAKASRDSAVNAAKNGIMTGPATQGATYSDPSTGVEVSPVQTMESVSPTAIEQSQEGPQQMATPSLAPQQSIAANGMPNIDMPTAAEKPATEVGKFYQGDKKFDTKAGAEKSAEQSAPSTIDYFMKNAVPQLQEQYIAQGDVAKAEAWGQWAEKRQSQNTMAEWSKMNRAAMFGDMEKAADHAFNLYKQYEDGITPLSKETVKDKSGNVTGFNVRLKNDATGEVTSQFIDKKSLIELGLSGLAPDKQFEMAYKRQTEVDKATMDARIKAQERQQTNQDRLNIEVYKEDRADRREVAKGQRSLSEVTLKAQLENDGLGVKEQAKVLGKVAMLEKNGYTEDEIRSMMPALVGANEYKKTTDPTERRALIAADLMKNDMSFSNPKLTTEERNKKVDGMMEVIYGPEAAKKDVKPNSKDPAKAAALSDKPMAFDPKLPIKYRQPGNVPYHLVDGKYVPITGKIGPSAPEPRVQEKGVINRGASGSF
jgi:hypothetical protein